MLQKEIHQYLEQFFQASECEIIEQGPGFLTIQLTVAMDKELMNRPFYWTYLEKTGGIPNPFAVTFITDQEKAPDDLKGEVIHFGAPRLHQLFRTAKKFGAYVRLYEDPRTADSQRHVPLHPWLTLNMKVSYQCDRKKDQIISLGLNLINGMMKEDIQAVIEQAHLTSSIPDYCFTVSPIIKPVSGLARIEKYMTDSIASKPHTWAEEARQRWDEDAALLHHFYEEYDEMPETYEIEKQALQEQYEPKVKIEVINGGLIYLAAGA
ncbi:YqhG family protein [Bacillus sp. FJAT-50079]|uniref:YqhG family protein n=1 Tax=Bacillus sp. FJAT-50079 TaxID=2833577 RepID=UPI001BC91728|nr:YqhG family protein [Bacillus sp. FJAT-50079]MBS4209616.1 YqhG family protein [Bacillus sp. FJAT-50079]